MNVHGQSAPRRSTLYRTVFSAIVTATLLLSLSVPAADWYVAPSGTPIGPGTLLAPYDLATALSGQVGQPGDTFWLRGGTYALGHLDTQIAGTPGQLITFRPMPGEAARVDGSLSFFGTAGDVILRDLELFSSDAKRMSTQTNVGFNPSDLNLIPGIASYAPNLSFINLVIHDQTRHGLYLSEHSTNNLVYGCVVYNNGWFAPDNAEGHGMYVQSTGGNRELADNLVFSNSGANMHVYEDGTNLCLVGVTLDGNVAFNAGAIQTVRPYRDWLVGVDAPATTADKIVLKNNMGYLPPQAPGYSQVQIGREGINGSVALLNNYLPQGLLMNNWTIAAVAGNFFAAQATNPAVSLNLNQVPLAAAWNGNNYAVAADTNGFVSGSTESGFVGWQRATGFDSNSTYSVGNPSGTRIFLRPNRYEAGRANIIVYNWDNLPSVAVDVSSMLAPGAAYEVRNAEDFFAPPVLSGVFDGYPLVLPMTGLTVAIPNGPLLTPPPTGPTFNVFVLLPRQIQLQTTVSNGQVRISWPVRPGQWVLQSTSSLSSYSVWTTVTNAPTAVDDTFVVVLPMTADSGFYRLQAVQ